MASMVNSADACSSSSTPSSASSSSLKKASRRLTRNGLSLKRISVSSLTEARAATKSAIRAGKYRVKETSRDLWSRTKVPLAQGKRKSKELVDLSADLISNLSIRVQKTLHHGRDRQEHPFDPHGDAGESDHEYFWESDFSDASLSDSCDEEVEAVINSASDRGRSRHDYYDRKENEESDCEVADEVAGDCTRSEQAVECKSIRKIEDGDQYRPTVSHVPSIEQIKQQLIKIQQNSNRRRQQVLKESPANQTADQVPPSRCLKINPNTVNREHELRHATDVSEPQPKKSPNASLVIDHASKSNRKLATRAQRPREQPPPPPLPPPLPLTLPPSLLSSTSSLNSAPLSLSSTSSSQLPSSWEAGKEDTGNAGQRDSRNDVNGVVKNVEAADGNNLPNGCEREFNCSKRASDRQTSTDTSAAVEGGDEEGDDDTDSESSYEVPVDSCPWFRPDLTRSEAEKYLLSLDALSDGCFVIRPGGSTLYPFSLSLLHEGRVYHLNIRSDAGSSYSLGKGMSGRVFPNLKHLVLYYANKPLMLVSSKYKPAPNQNNNQHDLPAEPRKYVRLSLIG